MGVVSSKSVQYANFTDVPERALRFLRGRKKHRSEQQVLPKVDVFNPISGGDVFAEAPKTRAWRKALAQRRSAKEAVVEHYLALLRA